MKLGWIAVFALPVLCTPLSHPQIASPAAVPATLTSTGAKTATQPQRAGLADSDSLPSVALPPSVPARVAEEPKESLNLAAPALTEDELRQRMVGKHLYLRGLWLDDELHFDMHGKLVSPSVRGSFTLCSVDIERVRLTKRRVELEGVRYGIHFEDEGNWANQSVSFDRIRVTPKKKHFEIVLDRQVVVVLKKKKGRKGTPEIEAASAPAVGAAADAPVDEGTTTSRGESAERVRHALDKIFAPSLDPQMIAQMPDYWQYFYQAQLDHKSMEPTDPSVYHPGPGLQSAVLVENVVPASNDYAQRSEVAGVASYKVILGADGKPLGVAVYRPIGFGLDENAVAAIQKSKFAPAMKDGKPVASVFELAVNFRIYSKRTTQTAAESAEGAPGADPVTGKNSLPGIYTANAGH
jgi:hypothetical protein